MGYLLQVDVNGEEVFVVDQDVLSSFSGKFRKLCSNLTRSRSLKVIFHNLPGGPQAFELMSRFCYSNGHVQFSPSNIGLLHSVGHFLEMTEDIYPGNLIIQTVKSLDGIDCWTWAEILILLKECQDLYNLANSSILQRVLNCLLQRFILPSDTSPAMSPDSAVLRSSCDTKISEGAKMVNHRTWWFDDVVMFNSVFIEQLVKCMICHKADPLIISRFLFYYLKLRVSNLHYHEKCQTVESTVDLLFMCDSNTVPCKGLFEVFRVASNLKVSKCCKKKLEIMIGSQLDEATLDNLLIPAPADMDTIYNVNLILRFLKYFFRSGIPISLSRLKRLAALIDMYAAEVAPDSCLKPSKFHALIMALPCPARDSYDVIYQAIDMYLKVHPGLSEIEKMRIWSALNYMKLSSETFQHLTLNPQFSTKISPQSLESEQSKQQSCVQWKGPLGSIHGPSCKGVCKLVKRGNIDGHQVILYAGEHDLSNEHDNLKADLQQVKQRVAELEKICKGMQAEMLKSNRKRLSSPSVTKLLPRLC